MFWLALGPILLILLLMVGFRWSASRSGSAGYLAALLAAVLFFRAGPQVLAFAHARALLLILDVLYIIWGAYLLFRVVDEAGGIEVIGEVLPRLTRDRGMQALLIGWAFASFLQGVGGFGVPVAVIAPLLIGLGFAPVTAVVIPSLGHSWAVTFGSLGSSFNALQAATGLGWEQLAAPAAVFLGAACLGAGAGVAYHAGASSNVGRWETFKDLILPVLGMGILMAVVQYAAAVGGLWNIAGLLGGSAGLAGGLAVILWRRRKREDGEAGFSSRRLLTALSGYLILVGLTLAVQLISPLRAYLGQIEFTLDFPRVVTGLGYSVPAGPGRVIKPLRHAGTLLSVSALLAFMVFQRAGWYREKAGLRVLSSLVRGMTSSSVGITSMVMMAVIMRDAGLTEQLADGIAGSVGRFYPLLSPWLGALGAFMTGSNTNSNLVFGLLQLRTAQVMGIPTALILAAQTSGGALGSVIAPTKVIVGASTAGLAGEEGTVLRALFPSILLLLGLISLMTAVGVFLR